jgi:hypothetical protein
LNRPLSAFVDIVPGLRELPGAIGCSQETILALRRLTEFEIKTPDGLGTVGDSVSLYSNLRAGLFDLLDAVSDENALLVTVDDVQWLDPASAKIVEEMIQWSENKKILFMFTSRPGSRLARASEDEIWTSFKLHPIRDDSAQEFLESILGSQSKRIDPAILNWILRVGEGNPFFL